MDALQAQLQAPGLSEAERARIVTEIDAEISKAGQALKRMDDADLLTPDASAPGGVSASGASSVSANSGSSDGGAPSSTPASPPQLPSQSGVRRIEVMGSAVSIPEYLPTEAEVNSWSKETVIQEIVYIGKLEGRDTPANEIAEMRGAPESELKGMYSFIIENFKKTISAVEVLPGGGALSAGLTQTLSHRAARMQDQGCIVADSLAINGIRVGDYSGLLPVGLQLKGNISAAKTSTLAGAATYKFGNVLIGNVFGYSNDTRPSQEFGQLLSYSLKNGLFAELQVTHVQATQAGIVSQVMLGYDGQFVSPFVQQTLNRETAFGFESDMLTVRAESAVFSMKVLGKVASTTWGTRGMWELMAQLKVADGLSFKSNLSVSELGKALDVQFAFER